MPIRVLVIEDSAFMRKALKRMLGADPDIEIVGLAEDGAAGVRMAAELQPDVITLDVKMPVMDGLEALQRILADRPVPVLMLSSFTAEGAEITLRALELGAVDFIDKSSVHSSMDIVQLAPVLVAKIKDLAGITSEKIEKAAAPASTASVNRPHAAVLPAGAFEIIAIGASTGGPSALQALLLNLPADYPYPVVVVQHMPLGFTGPLAQRLDSLCRVVVAEAQAEVQAMPGHVYIAPAGQHLLVRKRDSRLMLRTSTEPANLLHKPSADVLFASVAKACGSRAIGILLTGMGRDGAKGLLAMREQGALTIAQDESTSVVWGMPRAAVDLGAAKEVLSLAAIRDRLLALAAGGENR